jgi:plasmid stabilization system protein ParE
MSYRVEFARQALDEIDEAYQWDAERSPEAAQRWYRGLRSAIETLADFPQRCGLAPENDFFPEEIRQLLYGRRQIYRILFEIREMEQIVFILHVRHGARAPLGAPSHGDGELEDGESGY